MLLSRSLRVTGVTIDSPQVTLLRTAAGEWNFASLAGRGGGATGAPQSQATPDFVIRKLELLDGRLIVGRTGVQKRSTYDHVTITASEVSMTSAFPVSLAADLPGGGTLKLDGRAGPLDRTDASLTPVSAKLIVKSLNLASTGFLGASVGLGGVLDLDAALESQAGEAETKGTATLSKAVLVAGGSPAGVPVTVNFDTKYSLKTDVGILNPSVLKVGNAAAQLNGTCNTKGEATVVQVKMHAADMPAKDLQAFLPALNLTLPKGSSLETGTLNADLQIAGPVNKLVTSGTVGMVNAKLAGFDLGSKLSAVASLAGIKTGKDLDIEKLTTELRVAPNGIEAANFLAVVAGLGSLTGAGTIDARNGLNFKMVAQLMKSTSAPAAPAVPGETNAQPAKSGGLAGLLSGGLSGLKSGGLKGAVQAAGAGCKGG